MTPGGIATHAMHSRRRGMIGWTIGVAALAGTAVAFYPAVPDAGELEQLMEGLPEAMLAIFGISGADQLFTPAGYLDSQLFALMSPLLLIIFVVTGVVATTVGEEEAGSLELLMANPISRRRVLTGKAVAMLTLLAVLTMVHLVFVAGVGAAVGLEVASSGLVAVHVSMYLLCAALGMLALALAGASGRRGLALGVTAAVAVTSYLLDSFAPLVDELEVLRPLSPFYLYRGNAPLENGLDPLHAGALLAITLALLAVATVAFDRRDIGT